MSHIIKGNEPDPLSGLCKEDEKHPNWTNRIHVMQPSSHIVDGNKPDLRSVIWGEDERFVHFKVLLASGTKQEDVMVGIQGGKLLIMSKVTSSHSPSPSWASSLFTFPKKKEEAADNFSFLKLMNFNLPVGVDPDGFSTSMDDAGVLTVTFKRLKPILSSTVLERAFDLGNVTMGWEDAKDSKNGVFDFKASLPAGTKIEDLMVGIERSRYLIIGMLQKKEQEGDTSLKQYDGNNFRSFPLPDGADPFGFSTAMDDAGVLTLTFAKLKPKKKLMSKSKLRAGLARGVMIGCEISDQISGADFLTRCLII